MFHIDVAMMYIFHTHVANVFFFDVAFCNEGFECSHQHETDVAVGFYPFFN
jgi:hypothetical protein